MQPTTQQLEAARRATMAGTTSPALRAAMATWTDWYATCFACGTRLEGPLVALRAHKEECLGPKPS